ncbi:MAG TPA: AAA family ATPase [Candidatus Baltobacteraceae bacterium]|nr:AAA family ATPase [Candidatus Baltobacteraceae bacterium]
MTGRSALVEWANQQDAWVRTIVSEIIATKKALGDNTLDVVFDSFLREKLLAKGDAAAVPLLSTDPSSFNVASALSLVAIDKVQYVNALQQGQSIDFNPRLTIIFGENAAGKTGYVRILKQVAGARTAVPVLPNVSNRTGAHSQPYAHLTYALGDEACEIEWHNEAAVAPLTRIDVFDSSVSALHVDGDLNYLYTPGELSQFPLTQQAIEAIRNRLDQSIRAATVQANPFSARFSRNTTVYQVIESLGASTDLSQLKAMVHEGTNESDELQLISAQIDALKSTDPTPHRKIAERAKRNLRSLREAVSPFVDFDAAKYTAAVSALREARKRFEEATHLGLAGVDLPGMFEKAWEDFIHAGEVYLQGTGDASSYPREGDRCIYCRQPLSREATSLLLKYRTFCSEHIRREVTLAKQQFEQAAYPVPSSLDFEALARAVEEALLDSAIGVEDAAELQAVLQTAHEVSTAVATGDDVRAAADVSKRIKDGLAVLDESEQKVSALISGLEERGESRQAALKQREAQAADIHARQLMRQLLPEIEAFVQRAKWVDRAKIHQRKFQGLLRSLTEAAKNASAELINRDFERRFHEESKRLRAPNVVLEFPGRQGQVSRRKAIVSDHKPSETLSEGEQKVIALADFLAEVTLKPVAPVIFDDPITSLDYKRVSEVADRIVALADERQVILFTHNIWFTTELLARFESRPKDCSYYNVAREGDRIGIVTKGTHPRADTVNSLRGRINALVHSAEKSSGEVREALVERGYELLRNACEVIVETELLQGVTLRYQPNVRMTMLPKIKGEALAAAIDVILPIFDDCCRYIGSHSQPMETLNVRPTLEALKRDWARVLDAREAYAAAS